MNTDCILGNIKMYLYFRQDNIDDFFKNKEFFYFRDTYWNIYKWNYLLPGTCFRINQGWEDGYHINKSRLATWIDCVEVGSLY